MHRGQVRTSQTQLRSGNRGTRAAKSRRLAMHIGLAPQWEPAREGVHKVSSSKRQVPQIKAGCLAFTRHRHNVRRCTAYKQRRSSRQIQYRGRFLLGLRALLPILSPGSVMVCKLPSNNTKKVHRLPRRETEQMSQGLLPPPSRLLADLKEEDLEQVLLAIPIYCSTLEQRKHGVWRPIQNTVECMDQDCKDKLADQRTMKCSGNASFEAHCGKNPKQHRWRNNFKVDVEGFRGQSVEKFMAAHGVSLDRRLPTAAALQSSLPLSPLPLSSVPATSLQQQH